MFGVGISVAVQLCVLQWLPFRMLPRTPVVRRAAKNGTNSSQARRHAGTTAGQRWPISEAAKSSKASSAASTWRPCRSAESRHRWPCGPSKRHSACSCGSGAPHRWGLDDRLGPYRRDRLRHPGQPVAAHDQHIAHAAVAQLGHHLGPKSGALGLLDPHTQDPFAALHIDPDDQVPGLDSDCAAAAVRSRMASIYRIG
jgi:hypothetical protein